MPPLRFVGDDVAHRVGGAPRRRGVVVSVPLERERGGGVPGEGLEILDGPLFGPDDPSYRMSPRRKALSGPLARPESFLGYDRNALRCSGNSSVPGAPRARRLVFVARHVSSCCTLAQSRAGFSPWAGYAAKVRLARDSYPHAGAPSSRRQEQPEPKPCPMFCAFVTNL